jgi:hypothetical protein
MLRLLSAMKCCSRQAIDRVMVSIPKEETESIQSLLSKDVEKLALRLYAKIRQRRKRKPSKILIKA